MTQSETSLPETPERAEDRADDLPSDELPAMSRPFKLKLSWQAGFTIAMFAFMYLPILVLTAYSLNASPYSANWEGFTWEWYGRLLQDRRVFSALRNSLTVATSSVGISAVLGTLMAVGLARYHFPGKRLFLGVSYLPLIVPDIAIAVATLVFLAAIGFPLSLWTIVAAHVVFCLA